MDELGTDLVEVSENLEANRKEETEKIADGNGNSKVLTEKMVGLMRRVSEYGYLTIQEIGLVYANQTYAYHVLNFLKQEELILNFKTTLKPRTAYFLSSKGYRLLINYGVLRINRRFHPQHYKPFIFNHRMACAKAGLILEGHPLIREFLPESLLWERRLRENQKICDGEFWFDPPNRPSVRVGLEIELTLKNSDKLADSFRDLKNRPDLDQIWWICGDETVIRSLGRHVTDRPWLSPQRHLFANLDSLLTDRHRFELRDPYGTLYTLDPARPAIPTSEIVSLPTVAAQNPNELTAELPEDDTELDESQAEEPESPEPEIPDQPTASSQTIERKPDADIVLPDWLGFCLGRIVEWIMDSWEEDMYGRRFKRWPLVIFIGLILIAIRFHLFAYLPPISAA